MFTQVAAGGSALGHVAGPRWREEGLRTDVEMPIRGEEETHVGLHLIIFAVTGGLIYLSIYWGVPQLTERRVPSIYAFFGLLWAPILLLPPLALALFVRLEGGTLSPEAVATRFRLTPITDSGWIWVGMAVLVTVISEPAFEGLGRRLARIPLLAPPPHLPAPFNPLCRMEIPPRQFFGMTLKGNWRLLVAFIPMHLVAMFAEEMMWRGYMLPLQETMFGPWAWVINGVLWAWVVHAFLKWHLVGMLPGMLAAPLVAQVTGSTWASLIAHAVPNSLLWLLLLLGVLGVGSSGDDGQ